MGRRPPLPNYTLHNVGKTAKAKKWWVTHKSKSLRELQVEALEWGIAEIEEDAGAIHRGNAEAFERFASGSSYCQDST